MFHFFPAEETFDVDEIGTAFLLNISTPKKLFSVRNTQIQQWTMYMKFIPANFCRPPWTWKFDVAVVVLCNAHTLQRKLV